MRIIQMLPTIAYGDAVGNNARAIMDILFDMGFESAIYAENVDVKFHQNDVKYIHQYRYSLKLDKDDVLIYHMSTGSNLAYEIAKFNCKKIMIYHNITPPNYFKYYNQAAYINSFNGSNQLKFLADKFDYCIVDSAYNKQDLIDCNFECPIEVLPIIIPFSDYDKTPNKSILRRYSSTKTNIVYVGRIAPNKKYEDLLTIFYFYKNYFNRNARLFLVGSHGGMDIYYEQLQKYVKLLKLDDVYFPGHVQFDEILSYYKIANMFVCMSDHEGFCVPLIEAMYFEIPVLAYASSAIPSTMDGAGILMHEKNPSLAAGIIDTVINNRELRQQIVQKQNARLQKLDFSLLKNQFEQILMNFMEYSK